MTMSMFMASRLGKGKDSDTAIFAVIPMLARRIFISRRFQWPIFTDKVRNG